MYKHLRSVIALCACPALAVVDYGDQIPKALSGEPLTNVTTYAMEQLDSRDLLFERQSTCYSPNVYCPGMQQPELRKRC